MSQNTKQKLGQFYTKNAKYVLQDLLSVLPTFETIIDPFAGEWDLLNLVAKAEGYDIDPKNCQTRERDTLLYPLDYSGRWVITNPPYLARNKNKDKTIYDKYGVDDLYKASVFSLIGCSGGVIVLPLNFFCSEDNKIREKFLSKYKVCKVNVFEETIFNDTTYTVCSFSFIRQDNDSQEIDVSFYPSNKRCQFSISKRQGYRIGYEVYNLPKSCVTFRRLLSGENPNTNLFLRAIDTGSENGKICLSTGEQYFGSVKDRTFATLVSSSEITDAEQLRVVEVFNEQLNFFRDKYHSMFLSNYRNSTKTMSRKRISFSLAYDLASYALSLSY